MVCGLGPIGFRSSLRPWLFQKYSREAEMTVKPAKPPKACQKPEQGQCQSWTELLPIRICSENRKSHLSTVLLKFWYCPFNTHLWRKAQRQVPEVRATKLPVIAPIKPRMLFFQFSTIGTPNVSGLRAWSFVKTTLHNRQKKGRAVASALGSCPTTQKGAAG